MWIGLHTVECCRWKLIFYTQKNHRSDLNTGYCFKRQCCDYIFIYLFIYLFHGLLWEYRLFLHIKIEWKCPYDYFNVNLFAKRKWNTLKCYLNKICKNYYFVHYYTNYFGASSYPQYTKHSKLSPNGIIDPIGSTSALT